MTRDEVLRLSRKAGLIHYYDSESQWSGVTDQNLIEQDKNRNDDRLVEILAPFAALVAAQEREACAKTCEARSLRDDDMGAILARAIRARSRDGN